MMFQILPLQWVQVCLPCEDIGLLLITGIDLAIWMVLGAHGFNLGNCMMVLSSFLISCVM